MLPISSMTISFLDWPSPDDHAVILFIAGCQHHCDGCQSPDLQNPENGMKCEVDEELAKFIADYCRKNRTDKVVLSGGDPLYHADEVQKLMDLMKAELSSVRFCIYTGFEYEKASSMIHGFDFIKCGPYVKSGHRQSSKTDSEMVLASPNQKIFDSNGRCLTREGVMKFRKKQ